MIFSRVIRFSEYILLSRHRKGHGIHSPFVYYIITRVFRKKTDPDIIYTIEQVRRKMTSDKRAIKVKDLGSRSGSSETIFRKVSDIAGRSPVSPKYGALLSNMAAEFGKPLIIELGTSLGISTMYMAASSANTTVCTIEGCPETAGIAQQNFIEAGFNNIKIMVGSFDEVIQDFSKDDTSPGLVFIDGNHLKEPLIKYFNKMAQISDDKTVIIIDDINYSKEMAEAWDEIKLHRKVSVSIDIFRMGILFLREGITHCNYTIRY
jgi:predicted O-methyltransferase YrrM